MNEKELRDRWLVIIALVFLAVFCRSQLLSAQLSEERTAALHETVASLKAHSNRLTVDLREVLSGGPRNMINLAERWDRIEPVLTHLLQNPEAGREEPREAAAVTAELAQFGAFSFTNKPVSNQAKDLVRSKVAGFTQAGTSVAWCGNNVVVGFFDSGSFLETLQTPTKGLSYNGVARSTDGGASFKDLGFLNPGPDIRDTILGNPTVACSDANTFFYASLVEDRHDGGDTADDTSDITVSKSTDGGATWGNPVAVVSKSAITHTLDHPWLAVDPAHPERIYLTYMDLDEESVPSGTGRCAKGQTGSVIELVKSLDGGITWSASPTVVNLFCWNYATGGNKGSRVAVGPAGEVYVAWRFGRTGWHDDVIYISQSKDAGQTFSAPLKVSSVQSVGAEGYLQGLFRINELPSLAADPRKGSRNVYVAWNDGRNGRWPEYVGYYQCADILFSRSEDGGVTWLDPPVRVNTNVENYSGGRSDQFFPALAVDKDGNIGVCYYDRRADENNFLIQRYCAVSKDRGNNWEEIKITNYQFPPLHGQDVLVDIDYMGDYDVLVSDFLTLSPGFIGTYADSKDASNSNVMATKF
jgi:hypothetical protein